MRSVSRQHSESRHLDRVVYLLHELLVVLHVLEHLNADDAVVGSRLLGLEGVDVARDHLHVRQAALLTHHTGQSGTRRSVCISEK